MWLRSLEAWLQVLGFLVMPETLAPAKLKVWTARSLYLQLTFDSGRHSSKTYSVQGIQDALLRRIGFHHSGKVILQVFIRSIEEVTHVSDHVLASLKSAKISQKPSHGLDLQCTQYTETLANAGILTRPWRDSGYLISGTVVSIQLHPERTQPTIEHDTLVLYRPSLTHSFAQVSGAAAGFLE